MKKNVYVEKYGSKAGNKITKSFTEEIKWTCVSYCGGPDKHRKCMVSDGSGHIYTLYCTGGNSKGSRLVSKYLNDDYESIIWSDTKTQLTNDELIELWNKYDVWYNVYTYHDYDFFSEYCVVYRGDDIPKYFVETSIEGPVDSKIDTYEEVIEEYFD